jgi:hypothetical protein
MRSRAAEGRGLLRASPHGRRFHSDEELVPFDVMTCGGGPPSRKGLIEQFEVGDLIRFHEQPVGKRAAAGTGKLMTEELDRAVEDSMIVRLQNALLMVIDQPDDAGLFDGRHDPWHRLQQVHPLPLSRVQR